MNRSWKIVLALLTALTASMSTLGAGADFTLGIFGNANMDDTVDEKDVAYVEGIIKGTNDATNLSDANYDGKIDKDDIAQIEQIINKSEKKLAFLDIFGEAETVNKPIKHLANIGFYGIEVTRVLNATNILLPIVGSDRSKEPVLYPEFSTWQVVGSTPDNCDFEKILNLKPDAVMTNIEYASAVATGAKDKAIFKDRLSGIPIICLNMREMDTLPETVMEYGYIIDREDEAKKFVDWFEGYIGTFKNLTKELSNDDRPRVYFEGHSGEPYKTRNSNDRYVQAIVLAGGKNIVDEIPNTPVSLEVSPEFVVEQNPQFIIICAPSWEVTASYETDDPSNLAKYRSEVMNRSELANVDAVKNNRVYVLDGNVFEGAGRNVVAIAFLGKLFHPDLFKDIDPQAILQEYTNDIWKIDFNVKEHGAFVYPPYETWNV